MLPTEPAICISPLYKTVSLYPVNWNLNADFALKAGWVLCEHLRPLFALFSASFNAVTTSLCYNTHMCLILLNGMAINRF